MCSNKNDIIFQIIDWSNFQIEEDTDEDTIKKYKLRIFGRTKKNKTVYVQVDNYTPFFYVEIPNNWRKYQIDKLVEEVGNRVYPRELENSLINYDIVERHKFYKFTNYKMFKFLRLIFYSLDGFRAYSRAFNKYIYHPMLWKTKRKYTVYESNIEPKLRFMHIRKLDACGWIKLPKKTYTRFKEDIPTISDINVYTKWTNIQPYDNKDVLPFVIASFDIECTSGDGSFPQAERETDQIIQIGTTFSKYGETTVFYKHMVTLGSCDKIKDVDVESYENERDVLIAWMKMIERTNPDIMTGYNIFGFDYKYLYNRSKKLGCVSKFMRLCRLKGVETEMIIKDLSSAALGENKLYYFNMIGRIQVDLMKVIQKDFKLASYKLDNVASTFIRENIVDISIDNENDQSIISTHNTYGLKLGQYISIYYNDGLSDNRYGKKYKIVELDDKTITITGKLSKDELLVYKQKYWCQAKDDVSPQDIFKLQTGNSADRAIIAKYCIQDCELCNKLIAKLQIVTNNIGMANVCCVPLSYLFLRGQGVKIFSLVAKKCRIYKHLIPVIRKKYKNNSSEEEDDEGYEGATVFPPKNGMHFEPIAVLDYSSLYPRSMIARNLSHECLVEDERYDNLADYIYRNVTYRTKGPDKTCRYAQKKDGSLGIVPRILQDLLDARTNTKKLMKKEKDPFVKNILDGLQLAYKVTANSLYGQTGATTSSIYCKDIAASTTATGREMLTYAKEFNETVFKQLVDYILNKKFKTFRKMINKLFDGELHAFDTTDAFKELTNQAPDLIVKVKESRFIDKKLGHETKDDFIKYVKVRVKELLGNFRIRPDVIYGDTDSIFINFHIYDPKTDENQKDKKSLETAIELGILAGLVINKVMPFPHDLEYEKTFWPFCILTKKRYVGNLYEEDPNKFKQKSMGIVLKRRDNAPIVKIVCGGIVQKLLNDKSIELAIKFTENALNDILSAKYPIDKFIITKTLRSGYKHRTRITHAVLADRMAERDPGNKPQSNDRIPYAYVETGNKVIKLQGERVEHPSYIMEKNLKLDYLFYITNQIMKPAMQFLGILVKHPEDIFNKYIIIEKNRRKGKKPINFYFGNTKVKPLDIMDLFNDNIGEIRSSKKKRKPKKKIKI